MVRTLVENHRKFLAFLDRRVGSRDVAEDILQDAFVRGLLDTLKPEYADALRRVDLEESSVKAFAQASGISANNASVRLFRAREALRQQVRRSCGTCADHGCLDCGCGRPAMPDH